MTRSPSLRSRLMLLIVAALLPLAIASGIALLALVNQQRQQAERAGMELARALASAVEAELTSSIEVLQSVATSIALDRGDLGQFHERARRVLENQPHWIAVILTDASGKPVVNTRVDFGAPLPPIVDGVSVAKILETRAPVIGNLAEGFGRKLYFTVRVPVMRGGELRHVISAVVKPEAILDVINRQRFPNDWVISVFDASGRRVARSRAHEENLGGAPAPMLQQLLANSPDEEGVGVTQALEGDRIYAAFHRLRNGWVVAPGIPAKLVEGARLRSAAFYGGGIALSIVLGILAALLVGRNVTVPMAALGAAAKALGRREAFALPRSEIREIRDVVESLRIAADERARNDAEREQLLARETGARGAAEDASREKDEFLAMLSHELRNPLGAISNAAQILGHERANGEATGHAREIISRQVEHLVRLTDDLLDAGRAVRGKILLRREPVNLAATALHALGTLKSAGRANEHRVTTDLEPAWVQGDAVRLDQIATNLIVNAIKYTPRDGAIRVSVRREDGEAVLRVADEGIGMSADLTARAFDLFVQGERGLDRTQGGLGIGLTLVKRLAALHDGSASVYSAGPGRGSEFTVRMPCIDAPAAGSAETPQPQRAAPRAVLLIEDNDDARESLQRLLELAGHRVRAERDGTSGLETALSGNFDIALIDIGLPRMDGYEVARRIRTAAPRRRPVLVALTGYGMPEDRARTAQAGFDAHLVKPVDAATLDALLRRADAMRES